MHLYVLAKGIKPHLDTWQSELLAQKVPLMQSGSPVFITPEGKKTLEPVSGAQQICIQLAVRPIQLFEIGFPKEHLDWVLANVGTGDYILDRYPILNYGAKTLRKIMGLKEVPKPSYINTLMAPHPNY